MWRREGLYHLHRAIAVTQRSSLNCAYCFTWNGKTQRPKPVPPKSWTYKRYQLFVLSVILIFEPILVIKSYQLSKAPPATDGDYVVIAYFTYPVAIWVWMILPFACVLARPSSPVTFVAYYESVVNFEQWLSGME